MEGQEYKDRLFAMIEGKELYGWIARLQDGYIYFAKEPNSGVEKISICATPWCEKGRSAAGHSQISIQVYKNNLYVDGFDIPFDSSNSFNVDIKEYFFILRQNFGQIEEILGNLEDEGGTE